MNNTTLETKAEIVQAYLDLHKNEFFPRPSDDTILANMIGGVYGECRCENAETGVYEIEISASDSKTGNPILFDFRHLEREAKMNDPLGGIYRSRYCQFDKYNTDGYTAKQLDELNRRADKALNGIDLDDPDSAGEVQDICEKILTTYDNQLAFQTWKLGTRYSPGRPWKIDIFLSLDDLLVEFDSLKTDGPEISIGLFRGDEAITMSRRHFYTYHPESEIENVKVEYAVGCRETGDIINVFPERTQAIKAVEEYEQNDTDEGTFEPDFYSYWAVADTTTI